MGFEQFWIMILSADFNWFQLIFNGFQINFNWFSTGFNWFLTDFHFKPFKKSIKKILFQLISIYIQLCSIDFPFETFKTSAEKNRFQLISIDFQMVFLWNLQEINWKERISTDFNLLSTDVPFKPSRNQLTRKDFNCFQYTYLNLSKDFDKYPSTFNSYSFSTQFLAWMMQIVSCWLGSMKGRPAAHVDPCFPSPGPHPQSVHWYHKAYT